MNTTLTALMDRLIPADDFPSASEIGVGDYLARHWQGDLARFVPLIDGGLIALDHEAQVHFASNFVELSTDQQDQLLRKIEQDETTVGWPVSAQLWLNTLVNLTAEGYYSDPENGGNRNAAAWSMVGFRAGPAQPMTSARPSFNFPERFPMLGEVDDEYDAIVVGAGSAGGIVACVLAEAGKKILLIERGEWLPYESVGRDHLRNHRLALYGHNTGPERAGNPRLFVDLLGYTSLVAPHEGGYHNNAMTVGGGSRVYGAQAWRFLPEDFRMASIYGVPEGSALADWPISYDDLAPYYERAEWEIGVAGADMVSTRRGPRQRGYPMPPTPENLARQRLRQGADKLGWATAPVPMAINTAHYQGRPACVQCGMCVGFACPSESKNGTHNTMMPRALATGNCTLLTSAQVARVETNKHGAVTGVQIVRQEDNRVVRRVVHGKTVVISSGAIESARLLLNSTSPLHPQGIGNRYDQVGRNFQGHMYSGALGLFAEPVEDGNGPGVSISTCDFSHGNPGIIGGGMLANEFTKLPMIFWRGGLPTDLPRWGSENKVYMRHNYRRTLHVMGPIQDIPNPDCRVTVAAHVQDRLGVPVAQLSGVVHNESVRASDFLRKKAEEWLQASGAQRVWSHPVRYGLSGGQHQAGTCRMGDDPETSVTDRWGRVHGHENLFVVDGSLHVTNGGFNPMLTIMALAFRCAEKMIE